MVPRGRIILVTYPTIHIVEKEVLPTISVLFDVFQCFDLLKLFVQ